MYLFQTYFQADTPVHTALSKTIGIGNKTAIQACDQLGIDRHIKLKNLASSQLSRLNQLVHQNFLADAEYRMLIQNKIKRLYSISSYRGFRHYQGKPCRGQRTHTNARTSKRQGHSLSSVEVFASTS